MTCASWKSFERLLSREAFQKLPMQFFLAQASVSERIATLENTVGTHLLDHLGRQVVPTKAVELLYKHGVLLMEIKRTARLEMENFFGLKQGEIHMGGSTISGEYILSRFISFSYR